MYCSSCGVAVTQTLTYCNHCGAKIIGDKAGNPDKATELRAEWAFMTSMGALFVCGLVAISILLGIMKDVLRFEFGPLMGFAVLSFLILIALEAVYVARLFRVRRGAQSESDPRSPALHVTKELAEQSRVTAEPVHSVTDHTTRTLDPIYHDRR